MPIYRQVNRKSSALSEELEKALRWWLEVLKEGLCEVSRQLAMRDLALVVVSQLQVRLWEKNLSEPVQLLCDARSTPPRIAAVCITDRVQYADMEPPADILGQFRKRGDNQIASLELLAVAFGKSMNVFMDLAHGVHVCFRSVDF